MYHSINMLEVASLPRGGGGGGGGMKVTESIRERSQVNREDFINYNQINKHDSVSFTAEPNRGGGGNAGKKEKLWLVGISVPITFCPCSLTWWHTTLDQYTHLQSSQQVMSHLSDMISDWDVHTVHCFHLSKFLIKWLKRQSADESLINRMCSLFTEHLQTVVGENLNLKQQQSESVTRFTLAVFIQSTKLPICPSIWSAVLDRGRQIGGLFWPADFPPRREHLFPPHLLSKNQAEMCRPLREVGGGVNDLHCCAIHSRGVLKPGNSWSQQSVHHFIRGHQDEQVDSCRDPGDAASPRSLQLFGCVSLLL